MCFKLCRDHSNSHFTSKYLHTMVLAHIIKRHSGGPQAIMYFKKRGMVSGQVMLLYSSYSSFTRAVGVNRRWHDNGGDLSDLCFYCGPSYY